VDEFLKLRLISDSQAERKGEVAYQDRRMHVDPTAVIGAHSDVSISPLEKHLVPFIESKVGNEAAATAA
jgi:hypothetical protein